MRLCAGAMFLPQGIDLWLMTRFEAEMYCESRGIRLATSREWELAARGTDGRIYPWGDQFDEARANVPGLPEFGESEAVLKPVLAYLDGATPENIVEKLDAGAMLGGGNEEAARIGRAHTGRTMPV